MKNTEPLFPNTYYHIYNHAVGSENLFRNQANYYYFLQKYNQYIFPVCETYSYSLMPNHFHFLIKVRGEVEPNKHFEYLKLEGKIMSNIEQLVSEDLSTFVIQQFSNYFNAYTKAYNKMFDRKGALFIDYMKRKSVRSERYFTQLINYNHQNPIHHNFCLKPEDWEFSSYHAFISDKNTKLNRDQVLRWYGGKEAFINSNRIINKFVPELEI